jgi:integral membrane protein
MKTLKILRIIALLEGLSLLILFGVGMPLKYFYNMKHATQDIGMAHGVLFLTYCVFVIIVAVQKKWGFKIVSLSLLASVVPFGTFIADKKFFK